MQVPSHDSIDQTHAATVSRLLAEPTPEAIRVYYSKFLESHNYEGVEVRYIDSSLGKGVFATKCFQKDELVLKEHMLVGAQHTQNKADALVCSFCYKYIGSIERQIGRRLLSMLHEDMAILDEAEDDLHVNETTKVVGSPSCCHDLKTTKKSEKQKEGSSDLSSGAVEALLNGSHCLPFSDRFSLAPITPCMGGCEDELFCSETCAKAAWDTYHSLLCTGPTSLCGDKDFLRKFIDHANETNDIFLVAAKVRGVS